MVGGVSGSESKPRSGTWAIGLVLDSAFRDEGLPSVAFTLERWLRNAPRGPLSLGEDAAGAVVRALLGGWSSTIVQALAAQPLTPIELERTLADLDPDALRDRLAALCGAGLVEARPADNESAPHRVTDWLREAVAPLAAAARWERLHAVDETAPVAPIDVEAAFLLTLPLLRLPTELAGACQLTVDLAAEEGAGGRATGVSVRVEGGRLVACRVGPKEEPDAWAHGPALAWLDAVLEADTSGLVLGGDPRLPAQMLGGLHERLIGRLSDPKGIAPRGR